MTLLEKMDRFCRWAVLDRLRKPRPLRWQPFLALAAIVASYILLVSGEGHFAPWRFAVGLMLYVGGSVAAALMRQMGPRLSLNQAGPLDERELSIQARASAWSGRTLSVSAMVGCFYMACADWFHLWRPSTPLDWVFLGMALQSASLLLPTLIASWLQPRPVADDED